MKKIKNEYLRFFLNLCIIVAALFVVDLIVDPVMHKFETYATEKSPGGMPVNYAMDKVNAEILCVGASDARFLYIPTQIEDSLGISTYNVGNDACQLMYQYILLHSILDKYTPKAVIWTVPPGRMGDDINPMKNDKERIQLATYYGKNAHLRNLIADYNEDFINLEALKMSSSMYRYNSKALNYMFNVISPMSESTKGYKALGFDKMPPNGQTSTYSNNYNEATAARFEEVVSRLRSAGTKVVFTFAPKYTTDVNDYHETASYKKLREITDKYGCLLVEDLMHDPDLMNQSFFRDEAHLNQRGTPLFNAKLIEEIRDYILDPM